MANFDPAKISRTRWYVIFDDSSRVCWWDRLFRTRPGFRHVYAIRWDGFNWLLFNPDADFTEVAIMAAGAQDAIGSLVSDTATVFEVTANRMRGKIRGRWWMGPMTCVEQIKAVLGVHAGRVWTPWQLYQYLTEGLPDGLPEKAESTQTHRQRDRAREITTIRARQVDTRRERAPQSHQTASTRPAKPVRLRGGAQC